ncbi:MAG: hypothetical protein ACI4RA_10595 [Kiritimatiellia bacterium]
MKTLLKWLVKKFITKDALKAALHEANRRIAEKSASERTQQIMAYGEDASSLTALYLKAYTNDGRIDDSERAAIDALCDSLLDKYISDTALETVIDEIIK